MAKTNEPIDAAIKERRGLPFTPASRALELRGKKISLVGIESAEPLRRGCDHGAWLQRLADDGVRHVLLPLNGAAEDTCMFARRHGAGGRTLYDLEHRDEGFFTRLKFLLEAAADTGVLIGLLLFDADARGTRGLLAEDGNVQGLSLSSGPRIKAVLETATAWVCSAVRGCLGVYVEVFRNAGAHVLELERALNQRAGEAFAKQGEDLSPERLGPWVLARRGAALPAALAPQAAPFDSADALGSAGPGRENFFNLIAPLEEGGTFFKPAQRSSATLLRFGEGLLDGARREWLWRALFRGYWPIAALNVGEEHSAALRGDVAALARFSLAWLHRAVLRPCADLFAGQSFAADAHPPFAAEDGSGRYFVYLGESATAGLQVSLPSGYYRYAWVNPSSGKCLDRGDGIAGGPRAALSGLAGDQARLLVLESSDLPDGLATL